MGLITKSLIGLKMSNGELRKMSLAPMKRSGQRVRGLDRSRPWQTDGTAQSVPRPSTRPATSRTFRPPHTCSESTTGSNGTWGGEVWKTTSGRRESEREKSWSWVQFREPDRSLLGLGAQVFERSFERGRPGDQDHVISYSQAAQRRIRPATFGA